MIFRLKFIILLLIHNSFAFNNPFVTISTPPTGQLRVIEPYKKSLSTKNILFFLLNLKNRFPLNYTILFYII